MLLQNPPRHPRFAPDIQVLESSLSKSVSLVLIPGSWHHPECYSRIAGLLMQEHGLRCLLVNLPSNSGFPGATFEEDIDEAHLAVTSETKQGRDVVVIAHSYGGMVGNSLIKRTRTKHRSHDGVQGEGLVIGMILIASGFTITGMAFMDPFFGIPPPSWRANLETGLAELVMDPRELFYHDVETEEADFWISQLTTQNLKALFEGGKHAYAGWKDVPVYYIGTSEDRGLPVAVQRLQIGVARGMGANVVHRELPSSHSPFLSMPDEVVNIIVEAVDVFQGTKRTNSSDLQGRGTRAIVPSFKLGQPSSWFKFGLPLGIGRLLGWTAWIFLAATEIIRIHR